MGQQIIRIFTLFVLGAILYDVLTHPAGTRAAAAGVNSLLTTGLQYSSGIVPKSKR